MESANVNITDSSSNSQPPAKKKALDILFGKEENNSSAVLEDEVELNFSENNVSRSCNALVWWKTNSLR